MEERDGGSIEIERPPTPNWITQRSFAWHGRNAYAMLHTNFVERQRAKT